VNALAPAEPVELTIALEGEGTKIAKDRWLTSFGVRALPAEGGLYELAEPALACVDVGDVFRWSEGDGRIEIVRPSGHRTIRLVVTPEDQAVLAVIRGARASPVEIVPSAYLIDVPPDADVWRLEAALRDAGDRGSLRWAWAAAGPDLIVDLFAAMVAADAATRRSIAFRRWVKPVATAVVVGACCGVAGASAAPVWARAAGTVVALAWVAWAIRSMFRERRRS
jgi:hypothetical protein